MLKVKLLRKDARTPTRGSQYSAGHDLYAIEDCIIDAGSRKIINTGIAIEIPLDAYGRIVPRSGLAVRSGIITMAGVIDADYTGEINAILFNTSSDKFIIKKGDRIAQLIIEKIYNDLTVITVNEIKQSTRGSNGFGSTGI
jgi:dUTP pyrophosphatase